MRVSVGLQLHEWELQLRIAIHSVIDYIKAYSNIVHGHKFDYIAIIIVDCSSTTNFRLLKTCNLRSCLIGQITGVVTNHHAIYTPLCLVY